MAHNYLKLSAVTLVDKWPGAVNPAYGIPNEGWDNTMDNFQTTATNKTPRYPLGTKIQAYTDNTNCPGNYTMAYLEYDSFESGVMQGDFSDSDKICVKADFTTAMGNVYDGSVCPYFVVTNEVTATTVDVTKGNGCMAFPCTTMSSDGTKDLTQSYGASYGWFWIGGVCPCKDVTFLDNTLVNLRGATIECGSLFFGGGAYPCLSGSGIHLEGCDVSDFDFTISSYGNATAYSCMSGVA